MKEYKVSKLSLGFAYFILALFVIAIFALSPQILTNQDDPDGKWFFIVWSIFVLFMVYKQLKQPISIVHNSENNILIFKSLWMKREIDIASLKKIKTSMFNAYNIYFKHEKGMIIMINRIENLHELISQIKTIKPEIITKGC